MEQQSHVYVAIMAGGIGSRFWPKSRIQQPKQFLDILGVGKTLLQSTYERFCKIVPSDHIYIVTGEIYSDLVKEQLPNIKDFQIVAEPMRRNTAPCIAYIAHKLQAKDPNAVFVVAPSDHLILETETFVNIVEKAVTFASQNDVLVTLGINPTRPHTGYGYIQYDEDTENENIYKVKTFTEKPTYDLAKTFLNSGDFLWNSGIFIWDVRCIIKAFETHQSDMNDLFSDTEKLFYNTEKEKDFIASAYSQSKSISIDYAIMEHAENVQVIPASFGWSDLGTWMSLWEKHTKDKEGNAYQGNNVMMYDSENCMVVAPKGKLVIVQGLQDYCVVDSEDVLMICNIEDEKKIKMMSRDVARLKRERYS
ncbi:MAG: mannose-1-phosphate guanylyltransferase [Chitinophagales bacterium]